MSYTKPLILLSGFVILCGTLFFGFRIQIPHLVKHVVGISVGEAGRPPLIGIYSATNAATSTFILLRTTDGIAQVFPGKWHVNFLSPQKVAVFGETIAQKNLQQLYILDGISGKQYPIAALPGEITNVGSNPPGTYLLITGRRANKNEFYSCVADTTVVGFPCDDVLTDILHQSTSTVPHLIAFWNMVQPHELVMMDQLMEKYFAYDPWEGKPRLVDATYFKSAISNLSARDNVYHISRLSFFIRVENIITHEKKTFLVWPWSEVKQISSNALIIKTRGIYEILNIENNTRAIFTTQDPRTKLVGFFKDL